MGWTDAPTAGDAHELLGTVDANSVIDAFSAALEAGWMLSLSTSRDGGALSISTTADGDRQRKWVTDAEELQTALDALQGAAKASLVS